MKTIFQILGLTFMMCVLTLSLNAQEEDEKEKPGIHFFKGSWEDCKAKAKEEGKPIFVDAYTSWCGPCKKMTKETFPDASVGNFFNQHYVNYKIDVEKHEDGPGFAKKYKVSRYPTLLFIDAKGEMLHVAYGFRVPQALLVEGRKGLFNEDELDGLEKSYKDGNREPEMVRKYITLLWMSEKPKYQRIANDYFKTLDEKSIAKPENIELIYSLADRITSPAFKLIMNNKEAFEKEYGKEAIADKMVNVAGGTLLRAIKNQDMALFKKITNTIESSGHENSKEFVYQTSLKFYEGMNDWKRYSKIAIEYLDKYELEDPQLLNHIAWNFYLHINSKKHIALAEEWVVKSIAISSHHYNNDTHAAILYKLGKKTEAIMAAEKAIEIAKMEKKDAKGTQELLDKILLD